MTARLALLLVAAAFASPRPLFAAEPAPVTDEIPIALPDMPPSIDLVQATGDQLFQEARNRIWRGDYDGALIVLAQAAERGGDPQEVAYLTGMATEYSGDAASAIAQYEAALARWPEGSRARDLRFRRAEAYAALGRYDEALKDLRFDGIERLAQVKVDLARAIWTLESGKRKKGLKLLSDALSQAGQGDVPFYQARARAAIAADLIAQARALSLDVPDKKMKRNLEQRAQLIKSAEKQVTAVALLKEPEWTFAGLLTLGQGYEDLADELGRARVPDLSPEQRAVYDETVRKRTEILYVKARRHYVRGTELALRLQWESPRIGALRDATSQVDEKIRSL